METGGNENVKSHSRTSLLETCHVHQPETHPRLHINSQCKVCSSATVHQILNDKLGSPSCAPFYQEWRLKLSPIESPHTTFQYFNTNLSLIYVTAWPQFQCQVKSPNSIPQICSYSRVRQPKPAPIEGTIFALNTKLR